MQKNYCPNEIESYVQNFWKKNKTFQVHEDLNKTKYYCLAMMPYPSGSLHIGHIRNYTTGDVIARYQRMIGKNVLYPIAWDAFGLPAENAAIKKNIEPDIWTYKNIKIMKKQLKKLGFSYDWDREIITCDPKYYRWEQWFFLKLYKKKLAYKKKSQVNWCPQDKTVLANEQVINQRCWRCDSIIEKKQISQWFLKITNYAEELLDDLKKLKKYWPKKVISMQKNWIGRSKGVEIIFDIFNSKDKLKIFTTRPDTFMGVTYLSIACNHKLAFIQSNKNNAIKKFIYNDNKKIIDINKIDNSTIRGINTGLLAIHPFTKKHIPIWINNSILADYGTGAVMCVPAHDEKDWIFANKYKLKIKPVILNKNCNTFVIKKFSTNKKDILFNSKYFNDLTCQNASKVIIKKIELEKIGQRKINYKLKDWCISRQRYWGTPIPIGHIDNEIIPIPESYLPILLLNRSEKKFNNLIINNKKVQLEQDTFDTFLESSWYYLRHTCPNYKSGIIDSVKANYWLPIDHYIGGIEHAILHLMYFRFFHKLLRDMKLVQGDEPAKKLICQGMVLSDAFYFLKNNQRCWISPDKINVIRNEKKEIVKITEKNNTYKNIFYAGMFKMSKSKKNGVNPDILIEKYGADTLRLFIMFAAPIDMKLIWQESGIKGIHRFLNRLWNLVIKHSSKKIANINLCKFNSSQKKIQINLHQTIDKVSRDIGIKNAFNTAIAAIMKFVKKLIKFKLNKNLNEDNILMQESLSAVVLMLAPFTPHISFVLWEKLGYINKIDFNSWPKCNKELLKENFVTIIIQVNGKKKGILKITNKYTEEKIKNLANEILIAKKTLQTNTVIKKIIYVSNKVINFVL